MGKSSSMWALLFIVPCVLAGPILQDSCSTECRSPLNPKFRYAVGQTYTYDFQANSKTWMMGTSDDQADLQVKGQALVTFRSGCDAVLQLKQASISGLDEKVDASELQKRPLSFTWQDGTVESLCPEREDPAWVVNIKRSVLSMLQHTAQFVDVPESHVIESDVIGRCPTEYVIENAGKSIKVTKTKIPNQCSHRIDRQSSIPTVAYMVPAETQTIPLMNSTSICQLQIKDNVIQATECRETHLFRPLSTETGGARTEVTSSISLISTLSAAVPVKQSNNRVPSTLILDPRGVQLEFQDAKDINVVVRSICEQLAGESPARVSHLFNELVHSLRKASPKEVKAAYNGLRGKKICPESTKTEKLFLDALPQAGSSATISLMVDILKENKLSSRQTLSWYLSLPLAKFVDIEAIKAVLPLVDNASNSPVALLGLTGLARRVCNQNWEECQASTEVQQFSTKLSKMLGNKCKVDAKDEIKVISVLKALGNLGVMTPEVRATLGECVMDASLPATVRLAAVEATRNNPCDKQVKENLLTILEDRKEDAEIRIAAYQGVMRCPCSPSILRIQNILNTEETNQVGSYISSHLNNIKSNPTPGKENVRRLVKKLSLERSFPNDLRKYSRNLAVADFCAINNAGWDMDASVVYAPKSFIPRSASMNLTLDLFGQSVNLFEFGVRAENLERLLEAYLGPDGVVDKDGVAGLLEKASDSVGKFGENVWNRVASATRSKRANIKTNELTNLDKLVNMKEKPAGIKLDAFLRVFGAEIGMVNYRGASSGQPKLELMEGLQSRIAEAWRDLIEGAKRVEIDVARSMMFLDTSATFPTVAGFPLRLAVNGTTTVGLGLESQMDLPALLRDPLNANIKLKMNPLAVTELSASMTVDIAVAKTGIKMAATIHSSMASDFSARLIQGTTVEVKLDLPKSKMTLVDFKSSIMIIEQSANKAESNKHMKINNETKYNRGGCSERLTSITGLRLCASSSVSIPRPLSDSSKDPAPAFPFSGPTAFSIVLEKTESSMKGYMLSATTTQEEPKSKTFLMTFDTPGSKTNRKVSVKGLLTSAPTMTIKVDTKAPWGNLAVEAEMVNRPEVKSVLMKVTTNEKREYYGKVEVNVARADRKYTLATTVEAGWPQQPRAVILEGSLGHEIGRSVELNLKPAGPYAKLPYSFQVTVGREFTSTVQKVWLNNFQVITPLGSALLSTEIGRQDRNYIAVLNMKYGTEQKMNAVSFNGQVQSTPSADKAVSYKTIVQYKSSRFPSMNVDIKWDLQAAPTMLSNVFVLVHGPEMEHSTNRLYINKYIQMKGHYASKDFVFDNKFEVTYPRYALNLKLDQNVKVDERLIKAAMTLNMDNMKLFDSELALVIAPKDPKNIYELAAKMAYPGRTISLVDTGKRIDRNSFSMSPVLDIQPGRKIELNGKASLIKDQNGMSMNLDSEMRVSGFNSPIKVRHSFQYTGDMTMTTTNKIEWAGQPQLVLDGKVFLRTRSMPAIEMVFVWNERLEAKLDARLSKDESKMDLDLNMMRLQRRVKINSQHKFLVDTRSGSINVAWDADRDTTKQVGFDGTFTLSKAQRLMDFKSTLNIESRLYSLALAGKLGTEYLNGDHTVRMELQLPLMKKIMWNMVMSNIYQAKTITNRLEVETQMSNGGNYQISFNNNVNDLDRSTYTYNANTDLTIKGTNMEEIKMRLDSKRTVRADKRNIDFKGLLIAPKWGQNIDSSFNVEVSKDSFRVSSKYQRGSMLVTVESAGKHARPSSTELKLDGSFEVKAPKTSWQQMKITVASAYDIKSISNFDISEKMTIEYQTNKVIALDTKFKLSPSTVDMSLMLETPYQAARRQGLNLNGRFDPSARSEGSLVVMWSAPNQRQPQEARIEVEMERRPNQLRFKLTTATPFKNMESSELSFDFRSLEDSKIHEIDVVVGISEKKASLSGRFNLNRSQREVDLTLNLPSYNPLRFLARVGSQASAYTIETRVDWGTGTFTVEGTTKWVSSDDFDVQMKIHSPELGINNYELKGVNKVQNKQRVMELTVIRKSSAILGFKSVYDRKEDRTGSQISGSAQMSAPESQFTGTVKYMAERRVVDSSDEKGSLYKFEVDVTADSLILNKVNGHMKMTNKDQSGSLTVCTSSGTCQEGSYAYKDAGVKPAVGKEAHVLLKTKENGVQEIRGLRVKQVSSSNKFEHTAEVLFDEAKNRLVGYKVYRKDGEYGMEIYTPKRVSGAALEMIRGSGRQAAKAQYILTVWLDKTKAPERKLVIATTVEPHKIGEMEGLTTSTIIRHPILPKELEYKLEFHIGKRGRDLFHVKFDADVMDAKHQRWTFETNIKNMLAETNGRNITVDMELRSKGADVSALLSLYGGSNAEHHYTVGGNLKLKEKERIEKELFVHVDVVPQKASLTFGSPAKQTVLEGRWNVDKIVSYNRLQLSASTRIFGLAPTVYVLDMNTSPHIDIRVFSKGASENYHQVVGGLLDDKRFEVALIRQLNVQRKELAAVYVSLNSSELLTTRLTWKIEDLRALLTTVRSRSQVIASELQSIRSGLANDLKTIALKWRSFGNLKSTYDKLAADYVKQLKQLKSEVEQDESMKEAVELMENIAWGIQYLGELVEVVVGEWEGKESLADRIEKYFEMISDRVTFFMRAASKATTQLLEDVIRYLEQWKLQYGQKDGVFAAIRNFYQVKCDEIKDCVNKFTANMNERFNKLFSWVQSLKIGERNVIASLKEAISNANMDLFRERVVNFLDETVLLPYEELLTELAQTYPETTRSVYRYGKVPIHKIRFYLRRSSQITKSMTHVAETTVADKGSILSSWLGEVVVYDVKNGEIRYRLPLSRKVSSLRDLLKIFDVQTSEMKSLAVTSSLRDLYREVRAKYAPTLMNARLNGYASLIGSKGLITFDKKSFDLSGASCQYLLARDFLNMDFAVAVNFEQPSGNRIKKSVIFTDGADQVEIKDEQVLINNKPASLPVKLQKIQVHRQGDLVTVRRNSGAILRCDVRMDTCTFELSPFYAGRTMGLWGTFTNEHADDLSEPTGKISKDMTTFVNSWKINKTCKDNVQTVTETPRLIEAAVDTDRCDSLFAEKDSDLSSCFKVASPAPYHDLCLKFAYKAKNSESAFQSQLESLVAGYRATCRRWEVSM